MKRTRNQLFLSQSITDSIDSIDFYPFEGPAMRSVLQGSGGDSRPSATFWVPTMLSELGSQVLMASDCPR